MALSIRNPKTEALAREVAAETGENITAAVTVALEERLEKVRGRRTVPNLVAEIMQISRRCSALPTLDSRPIEDILGYGDDGSVAGW